MKMRKMFLSMLGVVCLVLTCGILVGCDQKENAQIQFEKESVEIEVDETAMISFTTTVKKPLLEVTIEQGKVDCEIQENKIEITGISEGQDVVTLTLHKDLVKTSATLNVVVKAKTISEPDDNDKQQDEQPSESTDPTEPKDEQDVDKENPTDPSESTNPTNPEGGDSKTPEESEGDDGNNSDEKDDQGGNGDDQDLNDSKDNPNEQEQPVDPTPDESKDGQDTEKENPTDPGESTNPSESTDPTYPDENDKGDVETQPDDEKDKGQEGGDQTKPTDPTNPDENKPTEPDVVEDKTDKYTADDLKVELSCGKQGKAEGQTLTLYKSYKKHNITISTGQDEDNSIDIIFEGCSIYVDGQLSGEYINEDEELRFIIENVCEFSLADVAEFDMILKFSVTDDEGTFYVDVTYHVIVE